MTGGGKTVFAEICMAAFREKYPEGRIIVVVPTVALLDQWYLSVLDELGVPKHEAVCFSGDEKPDKPARINIIVINSARTLLGKIGKGVDTFLIVDECHRSGSIKNALALKGAHRATLGLSATPEREYDEGFKTYVEPALGPIIYTYDYRDAYRDGVISPFDLINVKVDLLMDEKQVFDRLTKSIAIESRRGKDDREPSARLKQLLRRRAAVAGAAAMRLPVTVKLVERQRGQRTIIFHERVEAANQLVKMLAERKHSVTIYHSKIGSAVRRDNLRLYRRGVFDVIVCCRALDEGMNVPETSVGVIASATASRRQRIQRLGRVLRAAPGKDRATIYTIYATKPEAGRLRREAERLEGVASVAWSRGTLKPHG